MPDTNSQFVSQNWLATQRSYPEGFLDSHLVAFAPARSLGMTEVKEATRSAYATRGPSAERNFISVALDGTTSQP